MARWWNKPWVSRAKRTLKPPSTVSPPERQGDDGMALLVTPGQLNKRSDFYHQLASLTAAGLPIVQALESIERNAPGPSYVRPLRAVLSFLHQGSTLSEAFARLGNWIPQFDQALFEAGERSGRLDSCFRL